MTRVIAGVAGGRRLAVPRGTATRPTSDRAREGLFASVLSELGSLDGKRVMDLFAGSGAVGLEALSRGAEHVLLVESDTRAAAVIKANVAAVGMAGATVVTDRAERLLAQPPTARDVPAGRYDLVFADPPYAASADAVTRVLMLLAAGWLADQALVVIERATRSGPLDWPPGYIPGKSRRYGEATFWYGWHDGVVAGRPPAAASCPAHEE
jgi:16S rRNA (guanine966-N2)-methyltransferase